MLIAFFLTSTYDITYLDFLFFPDFINIKFNYLSNLKSNWLSGSHIPLLLSGILFLITKISLYKLSKSLFFELIFVSISSIIILTKVLSPLLSLPISISIIIAMLLHYRKNRHISFSYKLMMKKRKIDFSELLNQKSKLGILFSILFLLYSLFLIVEIGGLSLMSISHVSRLIIILIVLFLSCFSNYSNKIILGILPISFIFSGLIFSSILSYLFVEEINLNPMSLNAMTSIGLLPIIEIILSKYHLINYYENIESFLKIKRNLFKYTVNFILALISITYILYIFTQ